MILKRSLVMMMKWKWTQVIIMIILHAKNTVVWLWYFRMLKSKRHTASVSHNIILCSLYATCTLNILLLTEL